MGNDLLKRTFPSFHGRRLSYWLIAAVLTTLCAGCTSGGFIGLAYFLGGPPSIEPEFDKLLGYSLKDGGKRVAVVCDAPKELQFDVDDVDDQLAKHVAYRLNSHDITVVDPAAVQNWLDQNDDWDSPAEIGAALEADYVIYIEMHEYSLYEKEATNLYRGRTTAMVKVFDMSDGEGHDIIFEDELITVYPLRQAASTDDIPRQRFKNLYMSFLSEKVGQLFYERYAGSDIPNGVLN